MPIPEDLIEILVCPETRQPVALATAEQLEPINAKIRDGSLRNRGGQPVSTEIQEALIREDGKILYVIDDGIPVMLVEDSIELA
ncbi:MAG: Trm112 family protein [Myxococcota bacterium]|nr:Trm112 family protein [Myxococcota bacterium]